MPMGQAPNCPQDTGLLQRVLKHRVSHEHRPREAHRENSRAEARVFLGAPEEMGKVHPAHLDKVVQELRRGSADEL